MKQRMIAELGRTPRIDILNRLKRTKGMTVRELAAALDMSYMGVKSHCIDLHKRGYLDTWRKPKQTGRPEVEYRLTPRAHDLFPQTSNATTLDLLAAANELFGPTGAEKLLYQIFWKKGEDYADRLRTTSLLSRIQSLARIRDNDGHMTTVEQVEGCVAIVEHHSPILDLLRAYPSAAQYEADMFRRVLQTEVIRQEETISGLYCCSFRFPSTASGSASLENHFQTIS